jgi:hypothetical protein
MKEMQLKILNDTSKTGDIIWEAQKEIVCQN